MVMLVRLLGRLAVIGGVMGAVATLSAAPIDEVRVLLAGVFLLGGLEGLALCMTVANTSDRTTAIAKHLGVEVKHDDFFLQRKATL